MWSSPEENLEDRSSTVFLKNTNSARQKQRCYLSYKKFEHTEYNMDNNRAFRGRRRGMNYRWHKFDRKNHYVEYSGTPYATGIKNRRGKYSDGDQHFLSAWEDRKYNEREMTSDVHSETLGNWFKVTIPSGRKYDKTWLVKSIQNLCSVPFSPVDFHYDKHQARFFVQDARTASALKDVSYRICDNTNRKICIFVTPSVVPYSVKNKLTSEQMELLKVTVMKRYDASHKALDLEKLRFDQELMDNDIDMMLNRRSCMVATLQIIQSNIPELLSLNLCNNKLYQLDGLSDVIEKAPQVKILNLSRNKLKSVLELEKVKELKLEELWLEGNPFCNKYADQSEYISAVRDLFPKLLRLDGKELVVPKKMDVEVPPQASKETTKESEFIKNLIVQFLKEYYLFYDSGDRLRLLDAYHDEACFSLVIPFNFNDPNMSNLEEYFKYNRDIKKMKDSYMRLRLLKHTKRDIVDSLSLLPKTQHDFCSFWVDMCFHTDMMLCFSVNGLFKEVEGKCQGCIRAFTRIFIAVPGMNSRICIINDELIVRNATPSEIKKAFNSQSTPNSSVKTLSEEQQEMVKSFSVQSGMKPEWSQKCLDDNEWNYTKAGEVFTILKNEGKIPKEFFK